MKKVYIDADSFKNPQFTAQAIRIYTTKNRNIEFLVKGKISDFVTISDLPFVKIKENISEKELFDYRYRLIANDNPLENFNGKTTLYRFLNKNKNISNLVVSLPLSLNESALNNTIIEARKLFKVTAKIDDLPSCCFVNGFNTPKDLSLLLNKFDETKNRISLSDIFKTKNQIIFAEPSLVYYLFNIVDVLSSFTKNEPKKKEKYTTSFFSKKLFTFSRSKDELDYDSLFLYYLIEEDQDIFTYHIKKLANLTAIFKILYDIDDL